MVVSCYCCPIVSFVTYWLIGNYTIKQQNNNNIVNYVRSNSIIVCRYIVI